MAADYWIGHQTPEDAARNTRLAVERGFRGMKIKCTGDEPLVARCEAIWEVAGSGHTRGIQTRPDEYERLVTGFFERTLLER